MKKFLITMLMVLLTSCGNLSTEEKGTISGENENVSKKSNSVLPAVSLVNESGKVVRDRFLVPEGYERVEVEKNSFADYLRNLPLKPCNTKVRLYSGEIKGNDVYDAVIDMDIGDRDLQQCADAVIRLRSEYLYKNAMYDKIHFNFTNGFKADYKTWMNGNRITVSGNKASWVKKSAYSKEYSSFRKYLDVVFAYAGTLSLEKEMKSISTSEMEIGDVFIKGASPGHAVIVVDMAKNKVSGDLIFIIAQSYMPAQEIHILKNFNNIPLSPWYPVDFGETLSTPEWEFSRDQLKRFNE